MLTIVICLVIGATYFALGIKLVRGIDITRTELKEIEPRKDVQDAAMATS
jgi:hypothetical protein